MTCCVTSMDILNIQFFVILGACYRTISTLTAVFIPPAFSKAHGKLSSPAPRADFSMMKIAPKEPRRGGSECDADLAIRQILSRASSSIFDYTRPTVVCFSSSDAGL